MAASFNSLMQTRFFTPAFNSAIFDGAIRIYFAQYHEALALKLYFILKEHPSQIIERIKMLSKNRGSIVFILLYPTAENFEMSFDGKVGQQLPIAIDEFDDHLVVGVREGTTDSVFESIVSAIEHRLVSWQTEADELIQESKV